MDNAGIGDTAVRPEAEFFVFDDVQVRQSTCTRATTTSRARKARRMSGAEFEEGNIGHRPTVKGGYFPVPPVDSGRTCAPRWSPTMAEMGVEVEKHHHEVAPSQHELGVNFGTLVNIADDMQIYKYVVHNVAHAYGKTATFMPKPVNGDNGSGMHCHQSIWKDGNRPSPATAMPTCRRRRCTTSAASSSTPGRSTPSPTRRPTATSVWSRASRRRCCWPIRRRNRSARAGSRTQLARSPSASRCASRTRARTRTWRSPRC